MDGNPDRWAIMLPMTGHSDEWYTICRCTTAEAAGETVRMLIASGDEHVKVIRVERTQS